MSSLKAGYRTLQADNFEPIDADDAEEGATGSHAKFIAVVVLLVVTAASIGTLFAIVS
jgi:hypothetical protein